MAYTTPVFNVPVDVWDAGNLPSDVPPDFENVTCQFYVYSRVSFDVNPCDLELYCPAIQIRMPLSTLTIWESSQVYEVPAESGRYYRARFKERVHLGFVNEYLVVYVVQCTDAGVPLIRDIENAEPCDSPDVDAGEGAFAMEIGVECSGSGTREAAGHFGTGQWFPDAFITSIGDGDHL